MKVGVGTLKILKVRIQMRVAQIANFLALVLVFFASQAFAWGTQGHHVVVGLAEERLSPQARDEVNRLLALEPRETLASISTWADERRNPATARCQR
jgi:nuclease S1